MLSMRAIVLIVIFILNSVTAMADALYGRENLAAFFAAVVAARENSNPIHIHIVGDSKVTGSGLANSKYRLDQLLAEASNGYPVVVTYSGYGGQNSYLWATQKAADFVAGYPNTDLLIINYGTNERVTGATGGAQTIGQTKANHLAALAIIRAAMPPSKLSILFLGQTAANNWQPQFLQTNETMQEVNASIREVAEQTNNAYFDTSSLFQRAHSEAGWMEQLSVPQYGGGNIHPGATENYVLMGEVGKDLFPIAYNRSSALTLVNGWLVWADLPSLAPRVSVERKTVRVDGVVRPPSVPVAANTVLLNLPEGFRPVENRFYAVPADNVGGVATIQVLKTGEVRLGGSFSGSFVALDGISFRTD